MEELLELLSAVPGWEGGTGAGQVRGTLVADAWQAGSSQAPFGFRPHLELKKASSGMLATHSHSQEGPSVF